MSKTNLCIIGLSKQFTDDICKQLAAKLEMYYANIEEIFAYDLMDVGKVMEVCGIEYLEKEQRSILRRVCGYDNTLINIDYSLLNNEEYLKLVKESCLIIYIALDESRFVKEQSNEMVSYNLLSINKDVFNDRDCMIKNITDIVVECLDLEINDIVEKIFSEIIKFYA